MTKERFPVAQLLIVHVTETAALPLVTNSMQGMRRLPANTLIASQKRKNKKKNQGINQMFPFSEKWTPGLPQN